MLRLLSSLVLFSSPQFPFSNRSSPLFSPLVVSHIFLPSLQFLLVFILLWHHGSHTSTAMLHSASRMHIIVGENSENDLLIVILISYRQNNTFHCSFNFYICRICHRLPKNRVKGSIFPCFSLFLSLSLS